MNIKNSPRLWLWITGALASLGISTILISATFLQANSITSATTIPAVPTEFTAIYSTIPNGPEIQMRVTDNANNETEYRLYWHASGTAWPTNFQTTGTSTWSFPANTGGMQIAAPAMSGTYEYQVQACNSTGCSSSSIVFVNVPNTTVPNALSDLRLDPSPSLSTIFLKWNDNASNEDRIYVDRKFISDTNYAGSLHWAELSSNATSFSDTNVVPGQHYDYRVQACNNLGCSAYASLSNVITSSVCTSLAFNLMDNKTTYNVGDNVNYAYSCVPAGTRSTSITIQVLKPDGTATTYNSSTNGGAVLQQMGFSTSNLANGLHILRACLNDTSCGAGSIYSIPFTIVGAVTTSTVKQTPAPVPSANPSSTFVPFPIQNWNSTSQNAATVPGTTTFPQNQTTVPGTTIPQNPTIPQTVQIPATTPQVQSILSALSGSKCTRYLNSAKSTLDSNERILKNIKLGMRGAPENYVNFDAVTSLLANADGTLAQAKDLIKKRVCSQLNLESLRDRQDDINDTLQSLYSYHKDELQYFSAYTQCKSTLANRTRRINTLIKKERNKETKLSLQEAISEITQKSQKFAQDASNGYFPEVNNQCKDYTKGLDDDINFYLRTGKF